MASRSQASRRSHGIERQRPVAQVGVEGAVGLDQDLLHDIGGVDPRGQDRVHSHGDHPTEPRLVPGQQGLAGRVVPLRGPLDQFLRLRRLGIHRRLGLPRLNVPKLGGGFSVAGIFSGRLRQFLMTNAPPVGLHRLDPAASCIQPGTLLPLAPSPLTRFAP